MQATEERLVSGYKPPIEGKSIEASIYFNDSTNKSFSFLIGTLNQIKELYKAMKIYASVNPFDLVGNGKISPGEIEVKENDERTFSDIGIRDNFICKWKIKDNGN